MQRQSRVQRQDEEARRGRVRLGEAEVPFLAWTRARGPCGGVGGCGWRLDPWPVREAASSCPPDPLGAKTEDSCPSFCRRPQRPAGCCLRPRRPVPRTCLHVQIFCIDPYILEYIRRASMCVVHIRIYSIDADCLGDTRPLPDSGVRLEQDPEVDLGEHSGGGWTGVGGASGSPGAGSGREQKHKLC